MRIGTGKRGTWLCLIAGLAATLAAAPAGAHETALMQAAGLASSAEVAEGCPGRAIEPDRVIRGSFSQAEEKSYVMVPFRVPRGTTAVRIKYCFDGPDVPLSTPVVSLNNTLDLGLYEPRRRGRKVWGMPEFRGWGGSSHPDVTVSAQGFSLASQYAADPRIEVPGRTTRAFLPGPIRPGRWAVELGVAAVLSPAEGNLDGEVAWRVEIELADDRAFTRDPYRPRRYDERPAKRHGGWYAGDMHVHAEHSAYGDATMRETFDYAFGRRAEDGADLDFVTLSDYVSGSAWGEIGRHQPRYRGKLIARSAEVITYEGHLNNHVSGERIDYRTGPVLRRRRDNSLRRIRDGVPPRSSFARIQRGGGFTQINHPTIFPSEVPAFAAFCRGCPWDFSPAETGYGRVDAIEIATGPSGLDVTVPELELKPGPNPFTATAIGFYERALARGHRIAAVGVSDSHNAGRTPNPVTQAPIGEATTMVRAPQLSERGLRCAIKAGRTYVRVTGPDAAELRFRGRPAGRPFGRGPTRAIFGDAIHSESGARFIAAVHGGNGAQLLVLRNGRPIASVPVSGKRFRHSFEVERPGRYGLQLNRGSTIEAYGTPIRVREGRERIIRRNCRPARR